ncbi:hypothetical protein [Nesterenkonia jeotgali]|uniref:Uncharacterized protein n=1 Tax=Nesterenkonia jeotgali TaxID=317018 RepID=A0A839FUC7_9MICC|nr:hypothetical protein [Nesterenkonia jeotgali]MBA8920387.1 hypothetical protein [Nesterenkonia jeotgali]
MQRLASLHDKLSVRFHLLYAHRKQLSSTPPVFALEHDFSAEELDDLRDAVRRGVGTGLRQGHRESWLPFIVYAAEIGYEYAGAEYWPSFQDVTPGWQSSDRQWLRDRFVHFRNTYGGAEPGGTFAEVFNIIAWPIAHSVLPTYLQRHLAQLLHDFRGSLKSDFLQAPEELGRLLARAASGYPERFRVFCENTSLVGHVAAALLTGENEESPYLSGATLERIVESLSQEQQAGSWLRSARQSATLVRGALPNENKGVTQARADSPSRRLSLEPKLFLRKRGRWEAVAELPNLSSLANDIADAHSQLRNSRGKANGGANPVPRSALLHSGQEILLSSWPQPDKPFLQLQRGTNELNNLLAESCRVTSGPWWIFRQQGLGLALEVKGKFVRPGHDYILVGTPDIEAPELACCTAVDLDVQSALAYRLSVPSELSEGEEASLKAAGIPVVSHVSIRPIGIVASNWDGEGAAEWLAGEPAIIAIRSDLCPSACRVTVGDTSYDMPWREAEAELLFVLERIEVGIHTAEITLLGDSGRELASGLLRITIRNPEVRSEEASMGEGIRLTAIPNRPSMTELWTEAASLFVDGPAKSRAQLKAALLTDTGEALWDILKSITLPFTERQWRDLAQSFRQDRKFLEAYEFAEASRISVERGGLGFAALTAERDFRPLQWRVQRSKSGEVRAALVDRTDGSATTLEFSPADAPLEVQSLDGANVVVPSRGGLAIAKTQHTTEAVILPPDPNATLGLGEVDVQLGLGERTVAETLRLAEGIRRWHLADTPVDLFAQYAHDRVLSKLDLELAGLIGGNRWGELERQVAVCDDPADYVDDLQKAVGHTHQHAVLAKTIAYNLYNWTSPGELVMGFHQTVTPHLQSLRDFPTASRFLLTLASKPEQVPDWSSPELEEMLGRVLQSRFLYRVARFAVLGTRIFADPEDVGGAI